MADYKRKQIFIIGAFFSYMLYLLLTNIIDLISINSTSLNIISFIGVLELLYILLSYKSITGTLFNLYTLFIILLFLFNFGQCLGWAFNIHLEDEIGTTTIYRHLIPEQCDIFKAQIVCLESALLFHFSTLHDEIKDRHLNKEKSGFNLNLERNTLYTSSLIWSTIVIPCEVLY